MLEDFRDSEPADDATYWTAKTLYELDRYEEAVELIEELLFGCGR